LRISNLKDEDFVNYKKPSLFIGTCFCNWKCCDEAGISREVCQNYQLHNSKQHNLTFEQIYRRYINNPLTSAIVIGGLEPILQSEEVIGLIKYFREHNCHDDFVIYTGYYEEEIQSVLDTLKEYDNIIFKFGRFKPNQEKHWDEVLGVYLISDNQFGKKVS
jgi:pyruvate-formate lyase-activating enzyme